MRPKKILPIVFFLVLSTVYCVWPISNSYSSKLPYSIYPVIAGYERLFENSQEQSRFFNAPSFTPSSEQDTNKKLLTTQDLSSAKGIQKTKTLPKKDHSERQVGVSIPKEHSELARTVHHDRKINTSFKALEIKISKKINLSSDQIIYAYPTPLLFPSIQIDNVHFFTADSLSALNTAPNDTYYSDQWALSALNIESAWQFDTGKGITVAVIDSGLQTSHEDIAANVWTNPGEIAGNGIDDDHDGYVDDVNGWNFRDGNSNISDTFGHGTHVAGIIGALRGNGLGIAGIAPDAKIMSLRTFYESETTSGITLAIDAIINSLYYAADRGARVINMSLGIQPSWFTGTQLTRLQDAVNYAYGKGSIVVVAAGNNRSSISDYPALFSNVITVGALHKDSLTGVVSRDFYSSYGSSLDFMAPGTDILSLRMSGSSLPAWQGNYNYTSISGTSMATPMVSGLIALLLAQDPLETFDDIYRRLEFSSTDMGTPGFDVYNGWGMINPFKALSAEYYSSGAIKARFLPQPDRFEIVRTNYDLLGNIINKYDANGYRAVFEYYAGTTNVQRVTFYNTQNVVQRTNEYDPDGLTLRYQHYFDGNLEKFFIVSTGESFEYLDENYYGDKIGRISKKIYANGTYDVYDQYFTSTSDLIYKIKRYTASDILGATYFYSGSGALTYKSIEYDANVMNWGSRVIWQQNAVASPNGNFAWISQNQIYLSQGINAVQLTSTIDQKKDLIWAGDSSLFWTGDSGYTFLYDGISVKQVTDANSKPNYSTLLWFYTSQNGRAVWQSGNNLFYYNGTSVQNLTNIIGSQTVYYYFGINISGQVAWSMNSAGGINSVNFFDGIQSKQITQGSGWYSYTCLNDNGRIAWNEGNNVYYYDGSQIQTISLTSKQSPNSNYGKMTISNDGKIVWVAWDSEIYLYDGVYVKRLTNNTLNDMYPIISRDGSMVIWEEATTSDTTQDFDFYAYFNGNVIRLNQTTQKYFSPGYDYGLNSGGLVAWEENGDIYVFDGFSTKRFPSGGLNYSFNAITDTNEVVYSTLNSSISWGVITPRILSQPAPDFSWRSQSTFYPNGRIKSRTYSDGTYAEFRNENYYGDNTGRKTLSRDTSGSETRYVAYWGDATPQESLDDTAAVKTEEKYQSGVLVKTVEYYPSGNQSKSITQSSGKIEEFLDENFYGADSDGLGRGRKSREVNTDGSEYRYIQYWSGTDVVQIKDVYQNGTRLATYEYAGVRVSSGLFNGTGDYLTTPDSSDFDFSGGVWTVDFWIRPTALTTNHLLWGQFTDGNNYMVCYVNSTGSVVFSAVSGGVVILAPQTTGPAVVVNAWQHIAIVENGNSYQVFVNGNDQTSSGGRNTNRPAKYTGGFSIAGPRAGIGFPDFQGYIDEFRVSKGIARYTKAFTPETTPYLIDSYTKLLLNMTGTNTSTTFIDSSTSAHAVTPAGNAQVSTASGASDGSTITKETHYRADGSTISYVIQNGVKTFYDLQTSVINTPGTNVLGGAGTAPVIDKNIMVGSTFQEEKPTPSVVNQTNGSRIENPLFVDPANGNYTVSPTSPAAYAPIVNGAALQSSKTATVLSAELVSYFDTRNQLAEQNASPTYGLAQDKKISVFAESK